MADNFDFTEGSGKTGAADDVSDVLYPRVKLDIGTDGVGTPVLGGTGAVAVGVPRVTLASDDPAVVDLAAIEALLITIDSDTSKITACNTGAVVISSGTITANLGATDNAVLDQIELNTDPLLVVGGGAEATAIRVTIANDSTGLVSIDDGGGAITVDGSLTTVSTVTNLAQMGGVAISLNEGVLDTGVQRVTLATDDDAVAYLATIAGDTTNIETAIQIIDDWDAIHDGVASTDGPQLMGAYDSTKPTAVGDGDAVRMLADQYGRFLVGVEPQAFEAVYDSADASGEGETVHASAASTVIVVQSYIISVDAEMWVKLQDEASAAKTGKFWLKAGGGVAITLPDKAPIVLGVDKDLEVICEAAGNVSVSVTGYTIPG